MTAILTRFRAPTNTRGAAVIVESRTRPARAIPWDYAIGIDDNHADAVRSYIADHPDWPQTGWIRGIMPDPAKWLFVYVHPER